ncbi:MAG: T9SS type A sorting domain-containing protein, partial [Chryseobacterium sp.]
YSLSGQLVQTIENVENKGKVNLNKLPKGIYIVKTKNQSSKIIVD